MLYAMEVSEIVELDNYFHDPRFQVKKPNLRGDWKQRCGDNFYSRNADGTWIQHRNRFHLDESVKRQDTKFARVFIGKQFWYRGKSASSVPPQFSLLFGGRGARVRHDQALAEDFIRWVATAFEPGVRSDPNDNPDLNGQQT